MRDASFTIWVSCLALIVILVSSIPLVSATHELPAPVAWWKLDETVAGPVVDSAGTNDGTNNGATIGVAGHDGTAYSFDGVNDRVEVPDAAALDFTTSFTFSAWLDIDTCANLGGNFPRVLDKNVAFRLMLTESCIPSTTLFKATVSTSQTGTTAVPTTGFHHLAATFDNANVRFYVDGVLTDTIAFAGPIDATTDPLQIANRADGARGFDGSLDDIRVYATALTPSQVMDLYLDPEHHPCTDNTTAATGWVTPLVLAISAPLLTVAVLIGLGWALSRRLGGYLVVLAAAFLSGVHGSESVTASHLCSVGGTTLSNTLAFIAVPIVFLVAVASIIVVVATWRPK